MNQQSVAKIPIKDIIVDDDWNCRDRIVITDIIELAEQIKQMGLIQPVVVRKLPDGTLKLVAGYRRVHAHKFLKLEEISAIIRDDLSEIDAAAINLAENIERKNLTPLEEARTLNRLLNLGYIPEQVGEKLNRSAMWIQSRIAILRLPPAVQEEVAAGNINLKQVRELVGLTEEVMYSKIRAIKIRKERLESAKTFRQLGKQQQRMSRATKGKVRQAKEIARTRNYIYDLFGVDSIELTCLSWVEGLCTFERVEEQIRKQCALFEVPFRPIEEVERDK